MSTNVLKTTKYKKVLIPYLEYVELKIARNQLKECEELLNQAGVPWFVEVENFPGSSANHRLRWFLSRRKNVSVAEAAMECIELNKLNRKK